MDRIHYSGDSILTGTAIAAALLEYAHALAQHDMSATVEIPTLGGDGERGRSTILVGPASQLISDSEASDFDELVDEDVVRHLVAETQKLNRRVAISPVAHEEAQPASDWIDEL